MTNRRAWRADPASHGAENSCRRSVRQLPNAVGTIAPVHPAVRRLVAVLMALQLISTLASLLPSDGQMPPINRRRRREGRYHLRSSGSRG